MKIIDQTPFFNNETGTIGLVDRGKAMMKYGSAWLAEVEAQKKIIPALDSLLDKSYVLLRNITPPGLEASIPFILVGPTGIYVIYVTHLTGMYRAKGDQWGTISGSSFKPLKPNLLTRTERMARAVQVFLQRNKYADLTMVEAVLLCADPGVHVDSLRPIVRVVMRDALERFAVSIAQAHVSLSPEAVHDIANRLATPSKPASAQRPGEAALPAAASAATPFPPEKPAQGDEIYAPAFTYPDSQPDAGAAESWNADRMGLDLQDEAAAQADVEASQTSPTIQSQANPPVEPNPFTLPQENPLPFAESQPKALPQARRKRGLTRGQVILLAGFAVVELILLAVFGYLIITNFL
jgi:Nuclease-related domain